ncbi:MAG: hypothetical protein GY793_09745 [Proteobacteria bacterium]|nr:hypothetical protein [Pseudomonadota bacterium]
MAAITHARPHLGRILERKAKATEFDSEARKIVVHIPSGGLREPGEILNDFKAEMAKLETRVWQIGQAGLGVDLTIKTLHEKTIAKKDDKIKQVKENSIVRKILNDLVEADIVDVIPFED